MRAQEIQQNTPQTTGQIPAKWHRHYQNLLALHESLIADRTKQKIRRLPHSMRSVPPTEGYGHHLAFGILIHEQDAVAEVESALRRLLDGSYGICEVTGKPIPEARLRVVPWTRYSREALEEIERIRSENVCRQPIEFPWVPSERA